MTEASFLVFYPQFSSLSPGVVLPEYTRQANARFADFGEDAEEARRLLTAHRLTLYSAAFPPEGASADLEALSAGRGALQEVSSRKVGEVAVTYTASSQAASVSTGLADLKQTVYGLQLLSLLRLYGFAGYIP